MNTELKMLLLSGLLGIVHIFAAAHAATKQRGLKWNMSSREQAQAPLTGVAGRLSRASHNFNETFPYFLAAVVVVQFLENSNSMTEIGAHLYFWGRLAYLPIYAFDITVVRSLVWIASIAGMLLVFAGAF